MINQTITHYKITGKLGQGGMGDVYQATDTQLDREVAIKVLPTSFANDSDRLTRFEREAKVLAALNHPNIAAIYGIEKSGGAHALIMELVEGETLAERLEQGPLELAEALETGRQIAEALEAAHDKGIIHRDLKPDNVKIDPQGRVKVLDFGLAKTLPPTATLLEDAANPADAPTLTGDYTEPGKVMGTASYMSPEQSRGLEVDRRTDVWAFGCCLFEVLTGQRPFKGQTPPDLVAEILKSDPDLTIIPPETPGEVLTLLRRCLDKDPRRRLRDLGDIAITLEDVKETSRFHTVVGESSTVRAAAVPKGGRGTWWWKLAAVLGIAAVAVVAIPMIQSLRATLPIRSLAVLPFENFTGDLELEGMGDGLSRGIGDDLKTTGLLDRVPRWGLVKDYKDSAARESAIAKELSVASLIQGTIEGSAENLTINVTLVDGTTEQQLWSESFPASEDFGSVRENVVRAVLKHLELELDTQQKTQFGSTGTDKPLAYAAYQKGEDFLGSRRFEEARLRFRKAVEIDGNFTSAWDGIFLAAWIPRFLGMNTEHPGDVFKEISKELEQFDLERPNDPYGALVQILIAIFFDRDWKKVRTLFWKLQSNNLLDAYLIHTRSWYYSLVEGRLEEGIGFGEEAIALDPEALIVKVDQVRRYRLFGRIDDAMSLMLELPQEEIDLEDFSDLLLESEDRRGAKEMAETIIEKQDNPRSRCNLAAIYAMAGKFDMARSILDDLEEKAEQGDHIPYLWIAWSYGYLDDMDNAFRWLNEGLENGRGDWSMLETRSVPSLEILGEDPRYWEIIEAMEFPPLPIEHPFYEMEQDMRYGKDGSNATQEAAIRTLAVQPFENAKAEDSESQWLSKTLHEWLKDRLGSLEKLEIKPAGSAGVDATVEGTFVRVGDEFQVAVKMSRHMSQNEESLGIYKGSTTNIFQLQDDLALGVAEKIQMDLSDQDRRRIAADRNIDPGAYIAFRQGLEEFDKFTEEGFAKAEEFYQKSRLLDPDYVDPIAGTASVKWVPTIWGTTGVAPQEGFREAKEILAEAIRLDPTHSEVLANSGWIAMIGDWDWQEAADLFRRAIRADPDDSVGYQGLAWYFALVEGDYSTALSTIERAIAIEPKRANNLVTKAKHLGFHGEFAEALALHMAVHERTPTGWDNLERAASWLLNLGRLEEAQARAMNAVDLSGRNGLPLSTLAMIHVALENREEAEAIRDELIERSGRAYVPAFSVARVLASLGEWDSFFESIQTALDERDPLFIFQFRTPSVLDLCADQPRYWEVVDRLVLPGLPVEHPYHEKELQMRFGKGVSSISTSAAESKQRIRKVAVLPFTSIASEENQAWFADAVTQTLTTQLGKVQALSVIAHTSASQFKDSEDSVPEIARQLKVDALIEGSVIRVGDQVQITANLVNGVSGETQWGDIFVDSVDDLLSLQGKIALEIAKSVRITMTPENTAVLSGSETASRKALEYFLQGVAQKGLSEKAGKTKLRFAEQAIEEDPNFASAHILKAQILLELLYWGFARGDEPIEQLKTSLDRALSIDPRLPEAHGVAGRIAFYVDRDFELVEQRLSQAVKDASSDPESHKAYAGLLGVLQRHPESITHARRAQELDPLNARVGHAVAWAYFRSGDYGSALEASEEIIKLDEDSFAGYHNKAFTLVGMGQDTEAEKNLRLAYEKSGQAPFYLARLGYGLGVLGQKEEAAELLSQLEGIAQADPEAVQAVQFGLLYLGMGEDDKAIEWFERAIDDGDMAVIFLGSNFSFDADRKPLRDNPRYQPLLRRIGLPE